MRLKNLPSNPLKLDPEFYGSCACSKFTFDGCQFKTHCWRTGCCEYSGIHYFPDNQKARKYAEKIAEYICEAYMTEVNISKGINESVEGVGWILQS